jgi:CRISPR-associated protein Cmr5
MPRLAEQERARSAHAAVQRWAKHEKKTEYRQELQQLPARIAASGLGQTLAFYAAKGGPKNQGVEADVGAELAGFLLKREAKVLDLLDDLMKNDLPHYRRRTREALAYAEWLKRYTAALIEKPQTAAGGRR